MIALLIFALMISLILAMIKMICIVLGIVVQLSWWIVALPIIVAVILFILFIATFPSQK
jgi:hypothetical protein